jgi:hypothetical protein
MTTSVASQVTQASSIPQVGMDASTVTTIINNVNSLYSNVIFWTFGLLTLIGILLPVFISFLQRKQLKADNEKLSQQILSEMQAAKAALMAELNNDFEKELLHFEKKLTDMKNEMKSNIQKNKDEADGKAHHLQANSMLENKRYTNAFVDCLASTRHYASARLESNMKIMIGTLLNNVFKYLKKADFEKDGTLENKFEEVIKSIANLNENGRYDSEIKSLKREMKDAMARVT